MRCGDCSSHVDDRHGEGEIRNGEKHFLHLPSVPNERLCQVGDRQYWLVGSFAIGTDGRGMQEHKWPGCPYRDAS